jgi:D-alanine-D-alanine ligase
MRVVVVHHALEAAQGPDEQDVLAQAEVVRGALEELGHHVKIISCTLNLQDLEQRLEACSPEAVFNLVESLNGKGRFIHLFPFLLDGMGLSYTGCPAEAIQRTSNKINAKTLLAGWGFPTPQWVGPYPGGYGTVDVNPNRENSSTTWIIKSLWEHASKGLDDNSLVRISSAEDLWHQMALRADLLGGVCFGERFVCGREFNLSLLGGAAGVQVLPPAEIIFQDYDPEKPKIVGYRAKWDVTSREYHYTLRRFTFRAKDAGLLRTMSELAVGCWKAFGLSGYARIDFRVDPSGRPWILEINTNPCLSPDGGFAAALMRAGWSLPQAIREILSEAVNRRHFVPVSLAGYFEARPPACRPGNGGKQGASNSPHL